MEETLNSMETKYTESHEWIRIEGNKARVGITNHAQCELGDVVFVELPDIGSEGSAGEEGAVLESTKAAADVYLPATGKIVEVNEALNDQPELVNKDPMGDGWLFVIELEDKDQISALMDEEAYKAMVG